MHDEGHIGLDVLRRAPSRGNPITAACAVWDGATTRVAPERLGSISCSDDQAVSGAPSAGSAATAATSAPLLVSCPMTVHDRGRQTICPDERRPVPPERRFRRGWGADLVCAPSPYRGRLRMRGRRSIVIERKNAPHLQPSITTLCVHEAGIVWVFRPTQARDCRCASLCRSSFPRFHFVCFL